MTRHHNHTDAKPNYTPPVRTPRLRLKAKAPQSGYVDGAWWPRTDDLPAELPDLLAVLSVRLGLIDRVLYNLDEWGVPPGKVATGSRAVRLDGYRNQPDHSIEVIGLNRSRIVLMVVPPNKDPDDAHTVMMTAAAANNTSTIDGLLLTARNRDVPAPKSAAEQDRWESEGGAVTVTPATAQPTHSRAS